MDQADNSIEQPSEAPDDLTPNTQGKPKRSRRFWIITAGILVLLLISGSAYAYYGYIRPQRIRSHLETALDKASHANTVTLEGNLKLKDTSDNTVKTDTADYTVVLDGNSSSLSTNMNLSGFKYPAELRWLGQKIYFKLGGPTVKPSDLDAIANKATTNQQHYIKFLKSMNNQWYDVDLDKWDSAVKSIGASGDCADTLFFKLSTIENKSPKAIFSARPPMKLIDTSNVTVDGQELTRYDFTSAQVNQVVAGLLKSRGEVGWSDVMKSCNPNSRFDVRDLASDQPAGLRHPVYLYIDKNATIKRLDLGYGKNDSFGELQVNFKWGQGSVSEPAGSKPAEQALGTDLGTYYIYTRQH